MKMDAVKGGKDQVVRPRPAVMIIAQRVTKEARLLSPRIFHNEESRR